MKTKFVLMLFFFCVANANILNKNSDILKFKAFILRAQNSRYKILNLHNSSIKKIKEIQKSFKKNFFVSKQIKDFSKRIDAFKLQLISNPALSVVIKYFKDNINTLRLSALHFIRIYKFIIYIRCLLEWLPQINPHLNPFSYIFTYTNSYVQFFHRYVPNVFGIDLSGVFSWLFLEMIESYLS
ncbi:hypothetical protein C922_03886 [Plasmodium inui San Antonio 1]|uniref:YGGT family protein n=1 Tax=Plasmodium inui San Antonio 1 TaxID=1237626 RepID=W7A1V4_9APIC|nr:hypothetical protein C922_03886 [Plasmodium inui San Antonio 1]EUD65640.1 hypothetical protein C922_03886 [Plasmodium inui San Antonio 1]